MVRTFGHTHDRALVPAISVRDLKRWLDRGGDVVVRCRQPTGYDAYPGTIPGSIRIPPTQLPERYPDLLGNNDRILLDTVAGLAIAVWQKIAPLVLEARLVENSTLFQDYERMLPRCYECYVPTQPVLPAIAARVHEADQLAQQQEEQEAEGEQADSSAP